MAAFLFERHEAVIEVSELTVQADNYEEALEKALAGDCTSEMVDTLYDTQGMKTGESKVVEIPSQKPDLYPVVLLYRDKMFTLTSPQQLGRCRNEFGVNYVDIENAVLGKETKEIVAVRPSEFIKNAD